MKFGDLLWARGEFMKLYAEKPDLILVTSDVELDDLVGGIPYRTIAVRSALVYGAVQSVYGMKIEKQPKGWHIRDGQGNTIGR